MGFLPFSKRAKPWGESALRLRAIAGVGRNDIVDPWRLAPKVGLRVLDDLRSLETMDPEITDHLLRAGAKNWSAGAYPKPLPDGSYLCILNPTHGRRRQKISLIEEIAHRYLNHELSRMIFRANGICVRDSARDEGEAYGVGAAVHIPWHLMFPLVNNGATKPQLRDHFDVSGALIDYRLKVTAAWRVYHARQRSSVARSL